MVAKSLKETVYLPNFKNKADGLALMRILPDATIKTAFFDPQYRGVLDALNYGNEGKGRGKARCQLPQMDEETIRTFIREIDRLLMPHGHLFLWLDKFHLCQGVWPWLAGTSLDIVDLIVWDKGKIGMGYRTRRKSEYLLVLQKRPPRAKGCWTSHSIPDVWLEKTVKTHPHSKPIELQRALILATTNEGDWVLDPAAGGFSVLSSCEGTGRNFIGGDLVFGNDAIDIPKYHSEDPKVSI